MSIFNDLELEDGLIKEGEELRKEFVQYITEQMERSRNDLAGRHLKLNKYRRVREGIPEVAVKNTPFPNASNVVTPLIMWLVQTVFGEMYNTFAVRDPFWIAKALYNNQDLEDQTRVLTNYFGLISDSPTDLNLRVKNNTIHYDTNSLGTCFVKYPYITKKWKIMSQSEGGVDTPTMITAHDGLDVIPYLEEDVLYPGGATSLQNSPWIAFIDHYYKHDLLMLQESGIFQNIDEVLIHNDDSFRNDENRRKESERLGINYDEVEGLYDIAEVYCFWDVDGDGIPEDIIVTIHLSSGTVLREEYNRIGLRPFGAARYMFSPYQIPGRGICQMAEQMQDECDTTHNMRIDNNKLVNNVSFQAKRGAGIKPNETISPGKVFWVDEPGKDIIPFQIGQLQYASINEENLSTNYAQRATGVSEIMAGFADSTLKSRDTFGGQMLRLQQGKGMFAAVVENMTEFYSEMGMVMFYQLVHHKDEVMEKEMKLKRMSEEDLGILNKALSIPIEDIPMRLQFKIRTRNIEETKDVQRNNLLMYSQLLNQYVGSAVQAAMALENTQQPLPPTAHDILSKGLEGNTRIMTTILELMNIDNTEDYLIDADAYAEQEKQRKIQAMLMQLKQQMTAQMAQMGGMNGQGNRPVAGAIPQAAGAGQAQQGAGPQPAQTGPGNQAPPQRDV